MGNRQSGLEHALHDGNDERFFGLENFGNTCYANSVLQALYFCRPFRAAVLQYRPPKSASNDDPTLLDALHDLYSSVATNKKRTGVASPKKFYIQLRKDNILFNSSMQQDAQEMLNFLLNHIAEILQPELRGTCGVSGSSWVHELFEGVLTNETRCLGCETVSTRDECFLDLSVDIDQNTSITSCLKQFSHTEMLSGDSKYHCETCSRQQEAQKCMRIKRLPNVLALHLKRFKFSETRQAFKKLSYRVTHSTELRLFNTSEDAENPDRVYDLFAVVIHSGHHAQSGHYFTLVKSHRHWLLYDDEQVLVVPETEIEHFFGATDNQSDHAKKFETAYILFYQARDFDVPGFISRVSDKHGTGKTNGTGRTGRRERANGRLPGKHKKRSTSTSSPPSASADDAQSLSSHGGTAVV